MNKIIRITNIKDGMYIIIKDNKVRNYTYNKSLQSLSITFTKNSYYIYDNVSKEMFDDLYSFLYNSDNVSFTLKLN